MITAIIKVKFKIVNTRCLFSEIGFIERSIMKKRLQYEPDAITIFSFLIYLKMSESIKYDMNDIHFFLQIIELFF